MSADINKEEVEKCLQKILQTDSFKRSQRISKFLKYVVRQTLKDNPDTIRAFEIAVDVFDKGSDFDPQDPYVRNISGITRKALAHYYSTVGSADSVIIDVPIGNFVAKFRKKSRVEDTSDKYLNGDIPKALKKAAPANTGLPLLAIVPLRFVGSNKPDDIDVGEIVASETISRLTHSPLLNLVSRLSTARYSQTDMAYEKIGTELGADYILAGSYYFQGKRLQLSVEVSEIQSSHVVWAETLSCGLNELTGSDGEVVSSIACQASKSVINHEVNRAAAQPIESLTLHTSLLTGISYMHSVTDVHFDRAKTYFDNILAQYPKNARVNALMGQWYTYKLNRGGGWSFREKEQACDLAMEYCQKALAANSADSLALVTTGFVYTQFYGDSDTGYDFYKSAEKFNPNEPLVHAYKAAVDIYRNNVERARVSALQAIKLSPFDPQLHFFETCAAAVEYAANNLEEAERHALEADELNSNHTSNIRALTAIQVELGKMRQARQNARRLMKKDPGFTTSSYLSSHPTGSFQIGSRVARSLEMAGVPHR